MNVVYAHNRLELPDIRSHVALWFIERSYEVQHAEYGGVHVVQARKTGAVRTVFGSNMVFAVKIKPTERTAECEVGVGIGKWATNLGVAIALLPWTMGVSWIGTMFTHAGMAGIIDDLHEYLQKELRLVKVRNVAPDDPSMNSPERVAEALGSAVNRELDEYIRRCEKLEEVVASGVLTREEAVNKRELLQQELRADLIDLLTRQTVGKIAAAEAEGFLTAEEAVSKADAARHECAERLPSVLGDTSTDGAATMRRAALSLAGVPVQEERDPDELLNVEGDWYIQIGDQQYRAPNLNTVREWVTQGRVRSEHLLWHPSLNTWTAARDVEPLRVPLGLGPTFGKFRVTCDKCTVVSVIDVGTGHRGETLLFKCAGCQRVLTVSRKNLSDKFRVSIAGTSQAMA